MWDVNMYIGYRLDPKFPYRYTSYIVQYKKVLSTLCRKQPVYINVNRLLVLYHYLCILVSFYQSLIGMRGVSIIQFGNVV